MKRFMRWLVCSAAVCAGAYGVRLVFGDIWTQTIGIGAGLMVLAAGAIWLAGTRAR